MNLFNFMHRICIKTFRSKQRKFMRRLRDFPHSTSIVCYMCENKSSLFSLFKLFSKFILELLEGKRHLHFSHVRVWSCFSINSENLP